MVYYRRVNYVSGEYLVEPFFSDTVPVWLGVTVFNSYFDAAWLHTR